MLETPDRYFQLKKGRGGGQVEWLKRNTVYRGRLMSMTQRVVRLFAPEGTAAKPHVDVSYDWLTPCRDAGPPPVSGTAGG